QQSVSWRSSSLRLTSSSSQRLSPTHTQEPTATTLLTSTPTDEDTATRSKSPSAAQLSTSHTKSRHRVSLTRDRISKTVYHDTRTILITKHSLSPSPVTSRSISFTGQQRSHTTSTSPSPSTSNDVSRSPTLHDTFSATSMNTFTEIMSATVSAPQSKSVTMTPETNTGVLVSKTLTMKLSVEMTRTDTLTLSRPLHTASTSGTTTGTILEGTVTKITHASLTEALSRTVTVSSAGTLSPSWTVTMSRTVTPPPTPTKHRVSRTVIVETRSPTPTPKRTPTKSSSHSDDASSTATQALTVETHPPSASNTAAVSSSV
ncbi:Hypothetical protein, putative, partial [Bodo saltans]